MDFLVFMLMLVGLSAIVSFVTAVVIRSNALCIFASVAITELLAALYFVVRGADSPYPDMVLLAVTCTAIVGTPLLVGSSIGFVFLARRLYRRRAAASKV